MSMTTENSIKLRDGRKLGYAEYGDPNGRPVLHFHGFPSSRYEGCRTASDEIATRLRARVIVVERPGFGLSDFKVGRTIVDWPSDVVEFADALRLDRFAVTGLSGGGPYVATCAWKIPQRLLTAGIISGVSPLDAPGAFDGMYKTDRQGYDLARRAPWLLRLVYWWVARDLRRDPVKFFSEYAKELSEPDCAAFAQTEVLDVFSKMTIEAFRSGARGVTWDNVLLTRAWGSHCKTSPCRSITGTERQTTWYHLHRASMWQPTSRIARAQFIRMRDIFHYSLIVNLHHIVDIKFA